MEIIENLWNQKVRKIGLDGGSREGMKVYDYEALSIGDVKKTLVSHM